jgi:hypothetical protein
LQAETEQKKSEVHIRREMMIQELNKRLNLIDNEIKLVRDRAVSEANSYSSRKRIEINAKKLFPEHILHAQLLQLAGVNKTFYGANLE